MGELRACVYFSVIFLYLHLAAAKPMFGFWCDLVCGDDDDYSDSSEDDFLCWGCPSSEDKQEAATAKPSNPESQMPFNIVIPPSSGMNLTMWQPTNGGSWWMNLVPWGQGASAAASPMGAPASAPNATMPAAGAPTPATADATTTVATTTAAAGKK